MNKNIEKEKDIILLEQIVNLYLEGNTYQEISNILDKEVVYVEALLNYKSLIAKNLGDSVWNDVKKKNEEFLKQEELKKKEIEYKETMYNVIYYVINSLYKIGEIERILLIGSSKVRKMLDNVEFILNEYGEDVLLMIDEKLEIRKTKNKRPTKKNDIVIADPKYRKIVREDAIFTSKYEYSILEKVLLFLQYNGNISKIANDTRYTWNEIYTSLNDSCLINILKDDIYKEVQTLLEVENLLSQNKMSDRKVFLVNIIKLLSEEKDIKKLEEMIGYKHKTIKRILQEPMVPLLCEQLGINMKEIEFINVSHNSEEVMAVADYIIETKSSIEKTSIILNIQREEIVDYIEDELPKLSPEKYEQVRQIVYDKQDLSSEIIDRVNLEYLLFKRGYTIEQVSYLINNNVNITKYDLCNELFNINEEKANDVQMILSKKDK